MAVDVLGRIWDKARKAKKRIVLPEGEEARTVVAAHKITAEGLAEVVLLGYQAEIRRIADEQGVSLDGVEIVNPRTSPKKDGYAQVLHEMRKHKGLTLWDARTQLEDEQYYAVMMVKMGDADGEVSGAVQSTADTVRPALQVLKTAPGISCVSSAFIMIVPDCSYGADGVFVYSDCSLNIEPTAVQLAEIAISAAKTAKMLAGIDPVVAMLSFSTRGSARSPLAEKVAEATQIVHEREPGLPCDGEMQADAALIPWIGEKKAPSSPVAGKANVLIFPDLQSGNIAYKLTERLARAQAIGPLLQGIAKPVNDLSRGCSADDIVNVTAITAVQAAAVE
jgi:phosphate acetyltransferase